jgi:hypothetical protein
MSRIAGACVCRRTKAWRRPVDKPRAMRFCRVIHAHVLGRDDAPAGLRVCSFQELKPAVDRGCVSLYDRKLATTQVRSAPPRPWSSASACRAGATGVSQPIALFPCIELRLGNGRARQHRADTAALPCPTAATREHRQHDAFDPDRRVCLSPYLSPGSVPGADAHTPDK